ncbi:MAG: response regulator [bacterium]
MGYKIFILDDKEENREAARTALCGEHELRFTKSFEEGKSVLNEFDPDLAIIDLNFSFVEGEQEEVLGYRFRDEVLMTREFPIPTVILTGGIKNHGKNSAEMYFFINMCQGEGKYLGMTEVKRDLAIDLRA